MLKIKATMTYCTTIDDEQIIELLKQSNDFESGLTILARDFVIDELCSGTDRLKDQELAGLIDDVDCEWVDEVPAEISGKEGGRPKKESDAARLQRLHDDLVESLKKMRDLGVDTSPIQEFMKSGRVPDADQTTARAVERLKRSGIDISPKDSPPSVPVPVPVPVPAPAPAPAYPIVPTPNIRRVIKLKNVSAETCQTCGCKPGDGISLKCDDPQGCGFWKEQYNVMAES